MKSQIENNLKTKIDILVSENVQQELLNNSLKYITVALNCTMVQLFYNKFHFNIFRSYNLSLENLKRYDFN